MPRRPRPVPLVLLLLLPLGLVVAPPPARAENDRVPAAEDALDLDGRLAEPAWEQALALPVEAVEVPVASTAPAAEAPELAPIEPDVRVLVADGRLVVGAWVPEAPGLGIGLTWKVGTADLRNAGLAASLAYTPQDVRSARYTARGSRGAGREAYPFEGAVALDDPTAWSMETSLPLATLGVEADEPIVLAVVVRTRTPGIVAWSPPEAAFDGPATWAVLHPPEGGWPLAGSAPDTARIAAEDRRDERRMTAWRAFLAANQLSTEALLARSGVTPSADGRIPRDVLLAVTREHLVAPLEAVSGVRPDLAYAHVLRAEVLRRLGQDAEAEEALAAALAAAPGLREAGYALWVESRGPALAEAGPTEPSDYEAALRGVAEARAQVEGPFAHDGVSLGRALLAYKLGDFEAAEPVLEALAARYPFDATIVFHLERARAYGRYWPYEQQLRRMDAERDDLPRVRLATTKGDVVLELFEDDAPNTVKNFIWLAEHGAYDDTLFHRNVPFFLVQGGDPGTRPDVDGGIPGTGGPGWAIPNETGTDDRRRRPFRGVIAMAGSGADAGGSQFVLTTGTAAHLEGEHTVFGRVLEGQDVVDRLVLGDRLHSVEVLRRRSGTIYRPVTMAGTPAPEPR